ncbi:hypothetical protein [Oceanicella sp. SM1341]|uniref:hypothetical protein n=1 Tax=Oceanicella sp. SM1341 TaxID=1548889 RepID=UPI000E4CCAA9|nr:hypothetical protein [Oceanicella sp. SM1341]
MDTSRDDAPTAAGPEADAPPARAPRRAEAEETVAGDISLLAGLMQRGAGADMRARRTALIARISEQLSRPAAAPAGPALPDSLAACESPAQPDRTCSDQSCGLQLEGHCSFPHRKPR